jgi:membrane associated rhomboid family serine protease
MRSRYTLEDVKGWLLRDGIPAVKLIILANVLTFFLVLFRVGAVRNYLSFYPPSVLSAPWTVLTYPLLGLGDIISLLFAGYWLWVAGGELERAWGTRGFSVFFFLMSAVTALGFYLGNLITGQPVELWGLWLPLAGVTIAFAMRNPEESILFFFVIPLKLKYLALIDVLLVFAAYGSGNLVMGIFALLGCAFSYLYVKRIREGFRGSASDRIIYVNPGSRKQSTGLMGKYRDSIKAKYDTQPEREAVFGRLVDSGILELIREGKLEEAEKRILQCI